MRSDDLEAQQEVWGWGGFARFCDLPNFSTCGFTEPQSHRSEAGPALLSGTKRQDLATVKRDWTFREMEGSPKTKEANMKAVQKESWKAIFHS